MRAAPLLVLATVLASTTSARAQTAADRETARHLMDDGYAALDKGDAKAALDRFVAADSLVHVPSTRVAVAKAQRKLGLLLEARETALSVTRMSPAPNEPRAFAQARAEAQALSDALADRIPSLRIVVRGADGATVSVDGTAVPAASLVAPRRLDPGAHHVEAHAGALGDTADLTLAEGETREVVLELAAPQAGSATARPEASSESTPARTDGSDQEPPKESPHGNGWRIASYVGFGVGAAGLVAGAVTGLLAIGAKNSALGGCVGNQCPPSTYGQLDDAQHFGDASTVAFVVGGAGAAFGVVALLLSKPNGSGQAPVTGMRAGPGWMGWAGSF